MKAKIWLIIIIFGMFVTVGSIVVDLVLAFNGIFIPNSLGWAMAMVGVGIVALGAVVGIGNIDSGTL